MKPIQSVIVAILAIPCLAHAAVIHGTQVLEPTWINCPCTITIWRDDSFDFSTQTLVTWTSGGGDLSYRERIYSGQFDFYCQGSTGVGIVSGTLEELQQVPTDEVFHSSMRTELDYTYVVKTGDGVYAKFAIRAFDYSAYTMTLEYYVQTDGTPVFGAALPVESSTWGRVKALYR